ncbi:hypothetical protein BH10PSE2_BH10PSE2_00410 [soil metagenome]
MSVTYTDETVAPRISRTPYAGQVAASNSTASEMDYVPSYARRPAKAKKVRTWMILAPIAAVALIGGGAYMLMNSGSDPAPLAEPATPVAMAPATSPVVQPAQTTVAAPAVTTAPVVASARVVAPTVTRSTTARVTPDRSARVTPSTAARAPSAPREAAVRRDAPNIESTGPQPYSASSSSVTPAQVAPVASTPRAPQIVVAPLN